MRTPDIAYGVWPYVRKHAAAFVLASGLIATASALQLVLPFIGRSIVECDAADTDVLIRQAAFGVLCVASYHALSFLGHYRAFVGGALVEAEMLHEAMHAVLECDLIDVVGVPPGERLSAVEHASTVVASLFADLATDGIHHCIAALGTCFVVCYISIPLTVTFVTVVGATQFLSKWYKRQYGQQHDMDVVVCDGYRHATFLAALQQATMVRIFPAARNYLRTSFAERSLASRKARATLDFLIHSHAAVTSGITNALFIVIVSVLSVVRAQGIISSVDIALFFVCITQLQAHLHGLANLHNKAMLLLQQTRAFQELVRQPRNPRPAESCREKTSSVALVNVSVQYAESRRKKLDDPLDVTLPFALRDVSIDFPLGQITVVLGPSGSGKTSVLRLIAGLVMPTVGRVLSPPGVALLEQRPALLSGTVSDNIRFGRPDATDAEVRIAASLSGCLDFVNALPDGFRTMITNTDTTPLSGGELQRICLARVFLSRSPVVLLDEPTTGLDPVATRIILNAILRLKEEARRTIIFVTHVADHTNIADYIVLMERGRVKSHGTRDTLRLDSL